MITKALAAACLLAGLLHAVPARAEDAGFAGQTRCASPTCHGAALPADRGSTAAWQPWKSARTLWLNDNVDRHSRAYRTLEAPDSRRIAAYMGIGDATRSEKCIACHAPAAALAAESKHRARDGVSCEHCHGGAESWLDEHEQEESWRQKRSEYVRRGLFYDNKDFRRRAEKCASCHADIDHEIIAGGHPPLQFEMVAYAQVMKHWDDQDDLPPGAFSVDPALWAAGQLVGLRRTVEAIARRAGDRSHESLGKFPRFEKESCYRCHHKLLEDSLRQAQGHYAMTEVILARLSPEDRGVVAARWENLRRGVESGAGAARDAAQELAAVLGAVEGRVAAKKVDRDTAASFLRTLTARGAELKSIRRPGHGRSPSSNAVHVTGIELPWWYTTGAPEQTVLAIQALCPPALGERCDRIDAELRDLVGAVDRFDYRPEGFAAALAAIHAKLF